MNKSGYKIFALILFFGLVMNIHEPSASLLNNTNISTQNIIYNQDFSNWSNISITGDQPTYWGQNSDPATYTAVSAVSVEAGTYLNLLNTAFPIANTSYSISYDIQVSATASPSVRRFMRLYCYFDDLSTVVTSTLELWDQVGTFSYSTLNGISTTIPWNPSIWHHIEMVSLPYNNDSYVFFNYDGVFEGSLMITDGALLSISSCSFYAYQGKVGSGDTMKVDNFTVGVSNADVRSFNRTVTSTQTETSTITTHQNVTSTQTETSTITTHQNVTSTQTDTVTHQENVTVETTNTVDTLVTHTQTQTQPSIAPVDSSVMVVTLILLVPIYRKLGPKK